MPDAVVEVVNTLVQVVEIPAVVGPGGPQGANGVVTADQLTAIVAEVEADIGDGPDLVLLYENSKV